MRENTVITISRQYGSGGREVAELVAKKLGVRRYDRKIVAMAADNLDRGDDFADALERSYNAPENCLGNLGDYAFEKVSQHNRMYVEQAKVILRIAKQESAVFLGRCADYILKDRPDTFSFFIYADDGFRAKRAATHYDGASLKELDVEEKRRKQYYEFYTGQDWGSPQHYDLMINTSHGGIEAAADMILTYIERRQQPVG